MYKVGDKFKRKEKHFAYVKSDLYEIAMIRESDKKFIIFDDNYEARAYDKRLIEENFIFVKEDIKIVIDDKSLNNGEKTLKNLKAVHYNLWLDTDSIDIIKAKLTEEEYIGALKYNILKYQLRLGKKDCIESDMEKIEDYKRELNSILESKKC